MSMRRTPGALGMMAAALLLAGCASAPVYEKPAIDLPAMWQSSGPFRAGVPDDAGLKGNWWEVFGDAQLNQLAQQTLAHNQSLAGAAARLEQARSQVTVSSAGLFPQAGLQAGAARQKTSANRPLAAYNATNQSVVQNNYQLGFAVNYEADLFGRVRSGVQSARASAEQAAADFENVRLVLCSELAADYFNLRELDAEIDVLNQGIVLQQKAYDFIQARHELGAATGLDLAQQQSLLDASKTQLELLQSQRAQYEHAIATLTGTPAPSFRLPAAVVALTPPSLPVGLPSDVLQRRPDVAASERAVAAANANIGVARAAWFPSVMLQSSGGWDSNQMSKLLDAPSLLWSLGAAVTQSLFDAGKNDATVAIAQAGYTGAVANYRQSVLVAMQEVEDGMSGLAALGRAHALSDASVRSSQRVLELANDRYTGGVETYFDVITAQQTLLNNQRLAVQIRGKQMVSSVYLVKALGGGWKAPPP
ncbi:MULTISPECIES: efflux transporter outer membrane subunit [unclassified Duganella]|uniref:efflux transporter outer membrane subunit n=1 Tax=unclassified Duganella TaxID=2636909 RepID=UPI000E35237A|nr:MULTISPECIES: efflux transporter outer membrane subunit [unclassified Duganella]RFP13617.1 efflux transporter outer membrane subunit [Duganella sp. BJB475]RFP36325.1 efflux transporter outer membrane subunit [Duganella sp. BJB476]